MKAIILAAGLGSRLNPLTATRPKHLIPIAGRSILEYILEALREVGVNQIGLVVHYLKDKIQSLIGDGSRYNVDVKYIDQGEPKGTAHAIMAAEKIIGEETCIIAYGDVTLKSEVLKKALRLHRMKNAVITMIGVKVKDPWNYGVLCIDENGFLQRVVEKPRKGEEPGNLINSGIYIVEGGRVLPEIKRTPISPRGEYEFTDTIQRLIQLGERVFVLETHGEWWFDIGRPWDLLEANAKILGERVGGVELGRNVEIEGSVNLIPPVTIGDNCKVRGNCIIGPNTSVSEGVEIGARSIITNSIILEDTIIGGECKISHSIIGSKCIIESGVEFRSRNPDNSTIKMTIKGVRIDSERKKLGSIVGDYVFIGRESIIIPGTSIYPRSVISRNKVVLRDVNFTY